MGGMGNGDDARRHVDDREERLRERAEHGIMALVELLGGDPSTPRMRALPGRYIAYLSSLVPARVNPAGIEPAPPAGALPGSEGVRARAVALGRRRARVAQVLAPLEAGADPAPERFPCTAVAFTAVCDMHLTGMAGTVRLAHDGGDPGDGGRWLSRLQLDWLVGLLAHGLISERYLADQIVAALRRSTAGAGCAVQVRMAPRACEADHADCGALRLSGSFESGPLRVGFLKASSGN